MRRTTLSAPIVGLVTLGALAAAPRASAQIVNVQPLVSKGGEGFSGEINGSLNWRTGNVDLLIAKASALFTYQIGIHKLISSSQGEVGLKGGDEFIERVFTHVRHQAQIGYGVTWETFLQVASDRFKRIAFRGLIGTGPRYDVIEGPAVGFAVGALYMFEREVLGDSDLNDSGLAENNHRLSAYITGKFVIDPMISLIHTTYYQPRLDAWGDFRISSETDLAFKLTSNLSLSVGFDLAYDSAPPLEVNNLDTATSVSIGVSF